MIYLSSDLHLEFFNKSMIDKIVMSITKRITNDEKKNYLILAGDVCVVEHENFEYFFSAIQNLFEKIFYIFGNHEFYKSNLTDTKNTANHKITQLNNIHHNIVLLDNATYFLEEYDVLLIGSTLWSDLSHNNKDITIAKYMVNDFNYINNFTTRDYQNYYVQNLSFIENEIEKNKYKKILMITHHMPSYNLLDDKYKHNNMNLCFTSELDRLFTSPIVAWVYGHTHSPKETIINGIKFKCNPLGYIGENKKFKIIDELKLE